MFGWFKRTTDTVTEPTVINPVNICFAVDGVFGSAVLKLSRRIQTENDLAEVQRALQTRFLLSKPPVIVTWTEMV